MSNLLLSFYGDDFTGSTDVMEALSIGGVPTALFMNPPCPEFIATRFPNIRAAGVPGVSRSMSPKQMREELPGIFNALLKLGAQSFHYKVCSTFDSSPEIGNIGLAIDLAQEVFNSSYVPLVVGAPTLGRYTVFGNLFARVNDTTYRLDRHPTMSKHPITPMAESDLRLHLGNQTSKSIASFDVMQLDGAQVAVASRFQVLLDSNPDIVLFDVLSQDNLTKIGQLIWSHSQQPPSLIVGSSGVEYGLTAFWRSLGIAHAPGNAYVQNPVSQIFVVSGSCSPVTATQINWAVSKGFAEISLPTADLVDPQIADATRHKVVEESLRVISSGASLIVHAAKGPDDTRIEETRARLTSLGKNPLETGSLIGEQLGLILREVLGLTGLSRAVVTGGDTSGHATRQLGIYALELATPIAPGAPLCLCGSDDSRFDKLQLSLKGGQNGREDYFGRILAGRS